MKGLRLFQVLKDVDCAMVSCTYQWTCFFFLWGGGVKNYFCSRRIITIGSVAYDLRL
jgi:hypothetical protein